MANFIDCWNQLKTKGFKHANGEEVLDKNDRASIESLIKEHTALGVPHEEAARAAIQTHLDEAHEQLQSVYDQVKPAPVSQPTETSTAQPLPQEGAATGVHAAALEERPINAPAPGEVTGWEANTEQGHDWLDKGGDPQTIIDKFAETKAVTPDDMGRMRAALQRLQAGTDAAGDALRKDPSNPELNTAYQTAKDAEQRFTDAFKPMHTFASANLASLQGKVPFDEGAAKSFTGMHREFQANMGREFKPEEAVKADKLVKANTEAGDKYQAANDELFKTADKEFANVPSKIRGRAPTIKELGEMFSEKLREVCDV